MRVFNRIFCALLALALAVAAAVVAVEILLANIDRARWLVPWRRWRRWALDNSWESTAARVAFAILCLVGLFLLLLALVRQRPVTLPMRTEQPDVDAHVRRSGLDASLTRAALGVDGIGSAKARTRKRGVRVTATANRRDASGLDERLRQVLTAKLDSFELVDPPAIKADVAARER